MFKNILIGVLFVLLAFMTYVAWHNTKPLKCDDIVQMHNSYTNREDMVCEINL